MGNKITKAIDRSTLNIFVALTRKKAKEKVAENKRKFGRNLTKEEKKLIIKNVAKKTRRKAAVIGMFALGTATGISGTKLLNSINTRGIEKEGTEITVDLEDMQGIDTVNIEGLDDDSNLYVKKEKNGFMQSIKVDLNEINNNEELQKSAQLEVDELNNSDEVLNYIKEIYVDEYNQRNGTNISVDNVKLHKGRVDGLYIDKAENGDEIIRTTSGVYEGDARKLDSDIGIVSATIRDDNGEYIKTERMTYNNGEFVSVYGENEQVKEYSENTLTELGGITYHGIDYYGAFIDSERDIYKQRFVNAIREYKQSQIDDIKNTEVMQTENTSNEECEIGND